MTVLPEELDKPDPANRPVRSRRTPGAGRSVVAFLVAGIVAAMIGLVVLGGLGGPLKRGVTSWAGGLILLGLIIALVGVAVWASVRRRPRTRLVAGDVARELGLTYHATGRRQDIAAFGPLPGIPDRGQISHLMRGTLHERPLAIYSHALMVQTGYATVPVQHTVILCGAPDWPRVRIVPRNAFGRLMLRLGRARGVWLDRADFNRAFHVRSEVPDFAIALLGPELQGHLLDHPGISWHVLPGVVAMVYRGALRADRLAAALDRLRRFWALVPDELEHW